MATVWSCRTWRWLAKEDDVKSHNRETQQNLQEKETRVALFSSFHLLAVSHRHDNLSTNVWQLYIYRASVSTSLTQLLIVESSRWRKCSFNWHIEILARRSDTCWFITTMRWKKNWRKKRCRWVASSWLYLLSCIATASFVVETNCCSPPLLLFLQQQRAVHSNVTRQLVFFSVFHPENAQPTTGATIKKTPWRTHSSNPTLEMGGNWIAGIIIHQGCVDINLAAIGGRRNPGPRLEEIKNRTIFPQRNPYSLYSRESYKASAGKKNSLLQLKEEADGGWRILKLCGGGATDGQIGKPPWPQRRRNELSPPAAAAASSESVSRSEDAESNSLCWTRRRKVFFLASSSGL